MHFRESEEDINALDTALEGIFEGMKIIPGTVCRIAARYLENWGIKVTPANRDYIEERGFDSNMDDWQFGTPETHDAIDLAIRKAGLDSSNKDMNLVLAQMAVPIIRNMLEANPSWNHFKILDVGAGDGDTTIALLDAMVSGPETEMLASRCRFHLLEPSYKRVTEMGKRLETHHLKPQCAIVVNTFEEYLWSIKDGNFDMVLGNAVFHHMTTPEYLRRIYDKLTPQGVLAVGDWYAPVWSHPAFLLPLLQKVDGGAEKAARLRTLFQLKENACQEEEAKLPPDQQQANRHVREYAGHLGEELNRIDARSRIKLLEAMQSLDHNLADVKAAGLVTDHQELVAKHRGFMKTKANIRHLFPNCKLASVWTVGKIPR